MDSTGITPGREPTDNVGAAQPNDRQDYGIGALVLIARFHGIAADPNQIRHDSGTGNDRLLASSLALAARRMGLKAKIVQVKASRLASTPCPAMLLSPTGEHHILVGSDITKALVLNPYGAAARQCTPEEVMQLCAGNMILFTSRSLLTASLAKFDFTWFIPAVIKYRALLLETLLGTCSRGTHRPPAAAGRCAGPVRENPLVN